MALPLTIWVTSPFKDSDERCRVYGRWGTSWFLKYKNQLWKPNEIGPIPVRTSLNAVSDTVYNCWFQVPMELLPVSSTLTWETCLWISLWIPLLIIVLRERKLILKSVSVLDKDLIKPKQKMFLKRQVAVSIMWGSETGKVIIMRF